MTTPSSLYRLNRKICLNTSKLAFQGQAGISALTKALSTTNSSSSFSRFIETNEDSQEVVADTIYKGGHTNTPLTILLKIGYGTDGKNSIDPEYLIDRIQSSTLLQAIKQNSAGKIHKIVPILHNPEEHRVGDAVEFNSMLSAAFSALDKQVSNDSISSYGICSNGLSLPSTHPLHYPMSELAKLTNRQKHNFSTLMLPVNLLETRGLAALNLHSPHVKTGKQQFPPNLNIFASRPFTAYPDGGTGETFPFKLIDYNLRTPTSTQPDASTYSHQLSGLPNNYRKSLALALGHFDAEHLVAFQGEQNEEEIETIKGCRLLQGLIQEMDDNLGSIKSFAEYETELTNNIIPAVHDNFEEIDEETSEVLANFFKNHGDAVRISTAKIVRKLINSETFEGMEGPHKVKSSQSLQSFAMEFVVKQEVLAGVSVGFSKEYQIDDLAENANANANANTAKV